MKKKVLLLEDNAYMNNTLTELLELNNYEVKEATTISEAKNLFAKGVDFLIVDLNVSPEGLTDAENDETDGLILSGWIWLQNYVFKKDPGYKRKLIIYSAYVQTLRKDHSDEIKGIILIEKSSDQEPSKVIEMLKNLE